MKLGPIIFSIIFNCSLAINYMLFIIDPKVPCGEHGSVVESLLYMQEAPSSILDYRTQLLFWYAFIKRGGNSKLVPNELSSNNNLVEIKVALRFLGILSPNLASISGYLCSLRRFRSFFIGTVDSFCQFLKLGSVISQKPSLVAKNQKGIRF